MEINWYVLIGIIARLVVLVGIAVVVLPQQIREVRKHDMKVYRWLLLVMSLGFIALSILPFSYQATRLDTPSDFTLQNLASVSGNLALVAMGGPYIIFYMLAKRTNKR